MYRRLTDGGLGYKQQLLRRRAELSVWTGWAVRPRTGWKLRGCSLPYAVINLQVQYAASHVTLGASTPLSSQSLPTLFSCASSTASFVERPISFEKKKSAEAIRALARKRAATISSALRSRLFRLSARRLLRCFGCSAGPGGPCRRRFPSGPRPNRVKAAVAALPFADLSRLAQAAAKAVKSQVSLSRPEPQDGDFCPSKKP